MRSTSRHKGRLPALIFENEIGTRTEFGAPVEAACVNAGTAPQSDANAIGVRTNVLRSMSFFLKQPLRAVLSGSSSYRQRSQLAVNALSSANGPAHGRAVRKEFNGRGFDQHVARCIDERCLQSGVGDGLEFFPGDLVFSSMALSPVPAANAVKTLLLKFR